MEDIYRVPMELIREGIITCIRTTCAPASREANQSGTDEMRKIGDVDFNVEKEFTIDRQGLDSKVANAVIEGANATTLSIGHISASAGLGLAIAKE
ncbi:hypothetical protein GOP47_0012166 [Adiantum capillus-veneris]|uniref:Uncharacterized protein n=1 Tax=Adiantum capillus-veneris TaxID=13818 RepID=A0A9D4UQ70_ADICA|nr:hypothetical protein GOP47_0012166 [Adiantum capillus-veneris]